MSTSLFPMVFAEIIVEYLTPRFLDHVVATRSLGLSEGTDAIGVFPADWIPEMDSMEIGSIEPTMSRYVVRVQNLRIDADEVVGRAKFNSTSRMIRAILYRDQELRLALGGLSETIIGSTERVKKFNVTKQNYLNARDTQSMALMFLCTTDLVFETETTKVVNP